MNMKCINWFAIKVDRDFNTQEYVDEEEVRLYCDNYDGYKIITGHSFKDGILKVQEVADGIKNIYTLDSKPNNIKFQNTLYYDWKLFDLLNKSLENRTDYEPWSYSSVKALAFEFGLYTLNEEEKIDFEKSIYYKV